MKLDGRKEAIYKRQLNYSRLSRRLSQLQKSSQPYSRQSTKLAPRSLRGATRTVSPTKNLYECQRCAEGFIKGLKI